MITRTVVVICFSALLMAVNVKAFVRRDVSSLSSETTPSHLLEAVKDNMDQLRQCIDQSLARTVGEVNEKQLQPLLSVIGDHLDRVSKAFDDLTAPRNTQGPPAA